MSESTEAGRIPLSNDPGTSSSASARTTSGASMMDVKTESGIPQHLDPALDPTTTRMEKSSCQVSIRPASSSSLSRQSLTQCSKRQSPVVDDGGGSTKRIKLDDEALRVPALPIPTPLEDHEVGSLSEPSSSSTTPLPQPTATAPVAKPPETSSATPVSSTSASEGSSASSLETAVAAPATGATAAATAATPSHTSSSSSTPISPPAAAANENNNNNEAQQLPLKATTMGHLRQKYAAELAYMLKEFRKLERQLLGATAIQESAGSRERREKLHSFILHLEDTIRQIDLGCRLEAEGKSTVRVGVTVGEVGLSASSSSTPPPPPPPSEEVKQQWADSCALSKLTRQKEEEENVQKLEEHILGNLLPVKQRLKRQLAAQQGASRNPVGMPKTRGMQPPVEEDKGTTFAAAAAQRRKQQEEESHTQETDPTQFGKPLSGGGSSLTQKLHGATLGSKHRVHGHGVGQVPAAASLQEGGPPKRPILYGGMAPGSKQVQSGVAVAAGVHPMHLETPSLLSQPPAATPSKPGITVDLSEVAKSEAHKRAAAYAIQGGTKPSKRSAAAKRTYPDVATSAAKAGDKLHEEDKKKLRKMKKKRKKQRLEAKRRERELHLQMLRQQQAAQASQGKSATGKKGRVAKNQGRKKGPRPVEYICALCSETYNSTCDFNPWWALASHDCPKCRKPQIPRIDITARANQIEYHPALLAHAEEASSGGGGGSSANNGGMSVMHINPSHLPPSTTFPTRGKLGAESDSDSDLSDGSGGLSEDSSDFSDLDLLGVPSPADKAENESFGHEYSGPTFSDSEASRLLILMSHASTCPGRHKQAKQRDVCRSTKFMMLHVRDCPGTTSTYDICPFPWCRKVKHMLYHLVSCTKPKECSICCPNDMPTSLVTLRGLNEFRHKKHRERRAAGMAAAAAAAKAKPATSQRGKPLAIAKPVVPLSSTVVKRAVLPAARPKPPPYKPPVQPVNIPGATAKPVVAGNTVAEASGATVKSPVAANPAALAPDATAKPAVAASAAAATPDVATAGTSAPVTSNADTEKKLALLDSTQQDPGQSTEIAGDQNASESTVSTSASKPLIKIELPDPVEVELGAPSPSDEPKPMTPVDEKAPLQADSQAQAKSAGPALSPSKMPTALSTPANEAGRDKDSKLPEQKETGVSQNNGGLPQLALDSTFTSIIPSNSTLALAATVSQAPKDGIDGVDAESIALLGKSAETDKVAQTEQTPSKTEAPANKAIESVKEEDQVMEEAVSKASGEGLANATPCLSSEDAENVAHDNSTLSKVAKVKDEQVAEEARSCSGSPTEKATTCSEEVEIKTEHVRMSY